jgi:hypothetical protein
MSNVPPAYPPYTPPPPDFGYAAPPPRAPGSIKALSITAIVLGSLFLLCDCLGIVNAAILLATGGKNPMAPNAPAMNNPGVSVFLGLDSIIKLSLGGILLAGGIGGLRLARWARPTMIWWSMAALLWSTISLIVQLVWTLPVQIENTTRAQAQMNPQFQSMHGIVSASATITVIVSWLFWVALPICFLLLWRAPDVVQAFEQPQGPGMY